MSIAMTHVQFGFIHAFNDPEDIFHQWDAEQNMPQRGDMRSNIIGVNVQSIRRLGTPQILE